MMQRLITEYPDYRLVDGAYYLLGYCLGEQGEEDGSLSIFQDLVARFQTVSSALKSGCESVNITGAILRMPETLFKKVLPHYESPFYDKALYKLALTHCV